MPPPWGGVLDVKSPDGNRVLTNLQTDAAGGFTVDSTVPMDPYLGCWAVCVWRAQASGQGAASVPVTRTTAWFPVHVIRLTLRSRRT